MHACLVMMAIYCVCMSAVKFLEENTDLQCVVGSLELPTVDMFDVPASNG